MNLRKRHTSANTTHTSNRSMIPTNDSNLLRFYYDGRDKPGMVTLGNLKLAFFLISKQAVTSAKRQKEVLVFAM